jgi:spermidine synthase
MKDNITFSEMMVHIPLCTHKLAKDILVVSQENSDLINELDRHKKELEDNQLVLKNLATGQEERHGMTRIASLLQDHRRA